MRASHASRAIGALATVLLSLALIASGAVAQSGRGGVGAPIPLRPGAADADKPKVAPALKPGSIGVIRGDDRILRSTPSTGAPVKRSGDVEIGRLEALDPSSIGLLSEADGGLGLAMWAGSRMSLVRRLLPRLPMGKTSSSLQSLARRLLLTTARVPASEANTDTGSSLLALRIDRLAAGGHLGEINELLAQAPSVLSEAALIRTRMNAMLLEGDEAGACVLASNLVERSDDPMWQKAAAFCHALEGDSVRAELLEQLLAEAQHEDDAFFAAIEIGRAHV